MQMTDSDFTLNDWRWRRRSLQLMPASNFALELCFKWWSTRSF